MTRTRWELLLAAAAAGFSFLASAWVNGISRLTIARARRLADDHPRRGSLLVQIARDPRPYLTGALLVMLTARVSATVLVTSALVRGGVRGAPVIAIAVMTFILFQVTEIAPRSWALERLDHVVLASARPVWWLGIVLRPVASLMIRMSRLFLLILPGRGVPRGPVTSEEEIMSMVEAAESEEVIETEERRMIHSIFEFGDTVVREVMAPRPDMICVEVDVGVVGILDVMLEHGFSRLPVIRGDIDNVVGIVHARQVMKRIRASSSGKDLRASDLMRPGLFVPESKKVAELLRELQQAKTQMAIVVDEYGGTAGLVTMEDLIEEIVGEIADEHEAEEPTVDRIDSATVRVNARLQIDELRHLLDLDLPNSEWDSVGGLVSGILGRVPSEGDRVAVAGVEFLVEKMKGRRVAQVTVHRIGDEPGSAADG
ncbi:MAG: hemolysin family protein [Actinomycetota bacterium]